MLRHYTIHSTEMTFRTLHFLLFVAILLLSTMVSADDIEEVKVNNPPKVSGDGIYTESLQGGAYGGLIKGFRGIISAIGKNHKGSHGGDSIVDAFFGSGGDNDNDSRMSAAEANLRN